MSDREMFFAALALIFLGLPLPGWAEAGRVRGQTLYIPVYSEVPFGDKQRTLNLTATLSVRNTDLKSPITIDRVDYYSASGERVRAYLEKPREVGALAASDFIVRESDRSGGISASFLVTWESKTPVEPPYVGAIMVNSTYNQGVAFSTPARVLEQKP